MANIKLELSAEPFSGQIVTFNAPCSCADVTSGLIINDETYTVVDALGNVVTGVGGSWDSGAVVTVVLDCEAKKAYLQNTVKPMTGTVTLTAAGWSDTAPYTQTVTIEGILETDKPIYGVVYYGTTEEKLAQKEAYAAIDDLDTSANALTFTCFEDRPAVDLTIQLKVVR